MIFGRSEFCGTSIGVSSNYPIFHRKENVLQTLHGPNDQHRSTTPQGSRSEGSNVPWRCSSERAAASRRRWVVEESSHLRFREWWGRVRNDIRTPPGFQRSARIDCRHTPWNLSWTRMINSLLIWNQTKLKIEVLSEITASIWTIVCFSVIDAFQRKHARFRRNWRF